MRRGLLIFAVAGLAWAGRPAAGQTLTTLATFNGANGDLPYSGLIADPAGNLYGTTFYGGDFGYGTVFKLDASTHALTALASFNDANGANPVNYGRLVIDGGGNLYGTTAAGGANHSGTIFKVAAGSHAITTLASFDPATTGSFPDGGMAMDGGGNLYGTTTTGGAGVWGTVFELAHGNSTITPVAAFSFGGVTGQSPSAGMVADTHGNVYGTTAGGGQYGAGTIFEIDAATHAFSTLVSFEGGSQQGGAPTDLLVDGAGNLYGTTRGGAANDGTIFKVDAATHAVRTVATFDGNNGVGPTAGLIADDNGNLFGTTYRGGAFGLGTVFKLDVGDGSLSALASFDGINNGAGPYAPLIADANGNLYGTTTGGEGRAYGLGTVFEVSVPEPGSFGVLIIGGLTLLARRRRK